MPMWSYLYQLVYLPRIRKQTVETIIIIQITNNANPISIAILSFLYGAYVMIVSVILYEEHLEKEYE